MVSTVDKLLGETAARRPDALALDEPESARRLTWSELEHQVDAVAQGLSRAGLVAGQRVLVALGNRLETVAAYVGALRGGLVVVPLDPRSSPERVERVLADCAPRLALTDPSTGDAAREVLAASPGCRVVRVGDDATADEVAWDELVSLPGRGSPRPGDPESLAVLLYTSGTSGPPRAAMLTHRALLAGIDQVAALERPVVRPGDVVLGLLPLFHVYGVNVVLGQAMCTGAAVVLLEDPDPGAVLRAVSERGVSVLPVAPAVLERWRRLAPGALAGALGGVRLVVTGSAPLAPELAAWFREQTGLTVHQGYGLTETAPVLTSTLAGPVAPGGEPRAGSVGAPLPGVELDLQGAGGDDPGEIRVRGDNLFSGYWPDGEGGPGPDGWWSTGDVGLLDDDGGLVLVDRLRETVVVSGFAVYPREVEDVVRELPEVGRVAVVGAPDEVAGEAVVAYVVPADEHAAPDDLAPLVLAHCAGRLARFKRPSAVHVVTDLPRTVTGKVEKGRLRAAQRSPQEEQT